MKNFTFLLLAVMALLAACKKEDCSITCQNGGTETNCSCTCPDGFTGEFCETDNRPECVRENFGSVIFSNGTNDDFNVYVNDVYQGWVSEYNTFTIQRVPVGSYTVRFEQTDYIFSPTVIHGILLITQCEVEVKNIY